MNFKIKYHLSKLTKFGLIGIHSTLVDFIIFSLLIFVFEWNIITSHLTAFSIAVLNSYFFNKNFTFSDIAIKNNAHTITIYILLNTIGAAISTAAIILLAPFIQILIAKLFATILSLLWNYISSYFFIFSPRAQSLKK